MGRTELHCIRCGFHTDRISAYKRHITREKLPCKYASDRHWTSDVTPTLDNLVRGPTPQIIDKSTNNSTNNSNATNPLTNTCRDRNTINNTVTNNDNRVTNNDNRVTNITINPISRTDLTLVPDDVWAGVIKRAEQSGDFEKAIRTWIKFANFNPAAPANMNYYFTPDDAGGDASAEATASASAPKVMCYCRGPSGMYGWYKLSREHAITWMINDATSWMIEFAEQSPKVSKRTTKKIDDIPLAQNMEPLFKQTVIKDAIEGSEQVLIIHGVDRLPLMFAPGTDFPTPKEKQGDAR